MKGYNLCGNIFLQNNIFLWFFSPWSQFERRQWKCFLILKVNRGPKSTYSWMTVIIIWKLTTKVFSWFWKSVEGLKWLILEWLCWKAKNTCVVFMWFLELARRFCEIFSSLWNHISCVEWFCGTHFLDLHFLILFF